jgi:two-component system, NtrC family, sensor kinase
MKRGITFLFILIYTFSYGQDVVEYRKGDENKIIGDKIEYLIDEKGTFTVNEVIGSDQFVKSQKKVPNFGISSSVHWLKVSIKNKTEDPYLFLELRQPLIDYVAIYDIKDPEKYIKLGEGGDRLPFENREFQNPGYFFKLNLEPGETGEYLLKVEGNEQILGLLVLSDSENTMRYISLTDIFFGIYVGVIIALFLYNLFIFFTVREKVYLIYVVYILCIGLTQISLHGYTFQLFWPDTPYWANLGPYLFSCAVSLSAIYFMRIFLDSKNRVPLYHIGSYIFEFAYYGAAILSFLGYYNLAYFLILALAGSISVYMLIGGILVYRTGYSPAKYYLIGWSTLLIGIFIYVLKDFNILPTNFVTSYTMPIGSAVEVILLSFALADRINILKKEKEISQAEALQSSREKAKLVEEQNIILEQKVAERTRELETTMKHLIETQTNLVDAEKMASLGQLTAGIAHEINNPINFVKSNINPLKMDFKDIMGIIDCYDQIKQGKNPNDVIGEVDRLKEEMDYEYVLFEISQLFEGIEDGAKRTAEIVQGLKTFSYLDEAEYKAANLNEGIQSTLVLLRSVTNGYINIDVDYGELPLIDCFPGKMNQVFMNIISNAIEAIKSKPEKADHEQISIRTWVENNDVRITISDTGSGIPDHIKSKIFEPFFTTKDVGKGTGLGLSIVYNIIKKHDGLIEVNSAVNQGTTFSIILPIKQEGV